MKSLKFILCIIIALCSSKVFAIEKSKYDTRMAVVDIHLVLEKSTAIRSMNKEIANIGLELEKAMRDKEVELKKDEDAIIQKRGKISEEEFEKEVSRFNKKLSDTQNMMQEKKTKLDKAHALGMQQVQDTTVDIIKSLTKDYDFNIVLPSSLALYYVESLDITDVVISMLNKRLKTIPFNY